MRFDELIPKPRLDVGMGDVALCQHQDFDYLMWAGIVTGRGFSEDQDGNREIDHVVIQPLHMEQTPWDRVGSEYKVFRGSHVIGIFKWRSP